jgi:hypothetical protein
MVYLILGGKDSDWKKADDETLNRFGQMQRIWLNGNPQRYQINRLGVIYDYLKVDLFDPSHSEIKSVILSLDCKINSMLLVMTVIVRRKIII